LLRNEKQCSKLQNLKQVIRWDAWLKHENFEERQKEIKALLSYNQEYERAFSYTVDEFLRRYVPRVNTKQFDIERARKLCFDYLIEECTALCLWADTTCQYEVYPSRRNLAMSYTHKYFVLPNHGDLLHPVGVKFKNRKMLKPQKFNLLIMPELRAGSH
jgi:hypothetical protein